MTARLLAIALGLTGTLAAQNAPPELGKALSATYQAWRQAMVQGSASRWDALTASHRKMEIRNRVISEKRPFPASVFQVPAPPPGLEGLRMIHVSQRAATAKAAYYGKIDFGVGGAPTENILVLSFVGVQGAWKYDRADFVNLAALPEVRKEIAAGDLSYVRETPDFQASGTVPRTPVAVPPAKYIAKIYVFCPGREVEAEVNGISRHKFINTKEAEIVLGGAKDGANSVVFRTKKLPEGTGKEAFTVRVYLMSEIQGIKPIKAFEYEVQEGGSVEAFQKGSFAVDAATAQKLVP